MPARRKSRGKNRNKSPEGSPRKSDDETERSGEDGEDHEKPQQDEFVRPKVEKKPPKPPVAHPMSVYFQSGPFLTHMEVWRMLMKRMGHLDIAKINTIQFIPRAKVKNSKGTEERWVVTLRSDAAKRELLRGLFLNDKPLLVRRYDDLLNDEYKSLLRHENPNTVNNKLFGMADDQEDIARAKLGLF